MRANRTSKLLTELIAARTAWVAAKNDAYDRGYGHLARKFAPRTPAGASDYTAATLALRAAVGGEQKP